MSEKNVGLLKLSEAASLLGISNVTLRRWADDGDIFCIRLGKRKDRCFRKQDIDKLLTIHNSEFSQQKDAISILVVENDKLVAHNIELRLKNIGYTVSLAFSGEEAIVKAAKIHPNLVLMDIKLEKDMDGIEAAKLIRNNFNIPVVYLTAYTDKETVQRAKTTEPFGYIVKPFEKGELYSAIEIAIYKHNRELGAGKTK